MAISIIYKDGIGIGEGLNVKRPATAIAALALAVACAPSLAATQDVSSQVPQAPKPTFRSAVDLVSVAAVVRDRKGRFARNLRKDDFVVEDGGARREIVDFRSDENAPVRVALLFDVSGSMRLASHLEDARQSARQVLSALRLHSDADEAAVFSFDMNLQSLQPFTNDVGAIELALSRVAPYGQTSLYDAIAQTARNLVQTRPGDPRRRAVIVFTDGIDTSSELTPHQVSGIASAIDVPVYVMTVVSEVDREKGSQSQLAESSLRDLSRATGGDLFVTSVPAEESIAARQIVDELRHQYVLAFAASPDAGWHGVIVKTTNKDLTVRARRGYSAGARAGSDGFESFSFNSF
jgi:VWFA-related protein